SPEETEQLVTRPLERLLWQIDGVEHVYSVSRRGGAMVTVRFYVGQDRDRAMVKIRDKINENLNIVPEGVTDWLVSSVQIDDVPIVTLTVYSPQRTPFELRRLAEELKARLDSLRDLSRTKIFGGYQRRIMIEPNLESLAARKITMPELMAALQRNNRTDTVGSIVNRGRELSLRTAPGLENVTQVRQTVIAAGSDNRVVRVEDVATVRDGPAEPTDYVNIGFGPASGIKDQGPYPAVTLAFSKKKGTNAVDVAKNVIARARALQREIFPADVKMVVTRDYGQTADDKVNGLISSMIFAIITVVLLIALTMGRRESIVVGLAVPVSFALALFVNYIFGFTINRVTLFALILSLGLVVDDPITNVDNIQRHIRMGLLPPVQATLEAVREVLPPVIMSTLAIIVSFTPMFFITGMMGPYMGPMAINVPLTVSFSTLCALTFVPWLSLNLLKKRAGEAAGGGNAAMDVTPVWVRRTYAFLISPFLRRRNAWMLLGFVVLMLFASLALMLFKVPLKMLPFDNRNELQLILKMPEGPPLETTSRAVADLEKVLHSVNEVANFESYVGINAPIDFNGMVRHYGMRTAANQADIRINLADKAQRRQQSHSIALRLRDQLTAVIAPYHAVLNLVELPPGPPVLATITAEVYGRPEDSYDYLIAGADELRQRLRRTDPHHLAEIDTMAEKSHPEQLFVIDRDKASLHGLTAADITATLQTALAGARVSGAKVPGEREPLYLYVQLPYRDRNATARLGQLWLKSADGSMVQLAELGHFVTTTAEQPIYHKNLERMVFVTAESVGKTPAEMVLKTQFQTLRHHPLPPGIRVEWAGEGEWQITLQVFRDLGIAFGLALIGIMLLLVVQTGRILVPVIIMTAIPLTLIGIAPGFYLLNLIMGRQVGGYSDPVFFTATGMIGMIALGGIVIRNSIVLIEFIQEAVARGSNLREAILESGAVRFRPIMLTAITTLMGAWPITLDPIFSGLAWALIFGLMASTFFTLLVIPAVYWLTSGQHGDLN
ncbi:MAG: efflux RND transporter permease subunit, partial [Victivallales bacterium]|nr:efflux RND transporter permease subunit [Victivallales bacterium]